MARQSYDEIRETYSCALPTSQELKNFFSTMECHLQIDEHIGPTGQTTKNLVLYFTPFRGKFLNYVRCFSNSIKGTSKLCGQNSTNLAKKRNHNSPGVIYVYLAGQRHKGSSIKIPDGIYYRITNGYTTGYTLDNYKKNQFPKLASRPVMSSIINNQKLPTSMNLAAGKFILNFKSIQLLSLTDARRGFKILAYNIGDGLNVAFQAFLNNNMSSTGSYSKCFAFIETHLWISNNPGTERLRTFTTNMWDFYAAKFIEFTEGPIG